MFARFSPEARTVVVRAGDLTAAAGRRRIGTEFLLLALCEDTCTARALARQGVTAPAVRTAIGEALGTAPPHSDHELLAALGIDLDEIRRRVRALGGEDAELWRLCRSARWPLRVAMVGPARDLPFTGGGRKVLEVALWRRPRRARQPVRPEDLLHGILADRKSNAIRVLCHLRVDFPALIAALEQPAAA